MNINFRAIFKLLLWVVLVASMWTDNISLATLNAVVLAVLELEEINEKIN